MSALDELATARQAGRPRGITSVCSAHPLVLRAALRLAARTGQPTLIEATCNQVNHLGGYTGMMPVQFRDRVLAIAGEEGCPADRILLGGDHLGPNPWRAQPADDAMAQAEVMVDGYVRAGFRKIHLDASMGCAGEPEALDDAATAERAVRLAAVAERAAAETGGMLPRYVIGTEVPPPGGADHTLTEVHPTDPAAARATLAVHRARFAAAGLDAAWGRVVAMVVQPGVEFGHSDVVRYRRAPAAALSGLLQEESGLVFEAHSTDYQGGAALGELVEDGYAILKVGPELTFVLRETLYALDAIASDLVPDYGARPLMAAMEAAMQDAPAHWQRHYTGDAAERRVMRHYALSDRIRYYWPDPAADRAVARLVQTLGGRALPLPLLWQHMPWGAHLAGRPLDVEDAVVARVIGVLQTYGAACGQSDHTKGDAT